MPHDTCRIFIALPLSEHVKKALEILADRSNLGNANLRFIRPAQAHLTLLFLGETLSSLIKPIHLAIHPIITATEKFKISLNGLGVFPDEQNARILWLGLEEGAGAAHILSEEIFQAINPFLHIQRKAFIPHVTLCRIQSSKDLQKLHESLKDFKVYLPLKQMAERVVIYESQLTNKGPLYKEILNINMGPHD